MVMAYSKPSPRLPVTLFQGIIPKPQSQYRPRPHLCLQVITTANVQVVVKVDINVELKALQVVLGDVEARVEVVLQVAEQLNGGNVLFDTRKRAQRGVQG